jgi:hypothetical protein
MASICPYPGLRPFNEKESIYFKGREAHIDSIIQVLQEKHFLMVTGASGDGKSSLIYAGLIPRARAGFFKARFNNWMIADFRPERNPLNNLARSLHSTLQLNNFNETLEDLSLGFSSLVELYQKSNAYIDYESPEYVNADFEGKIRMKNSASNLLILVDQFEELFTNTENFPNGRPSEETITLNNLLINTSKICKEKGIPIYIVCTMRSDYIGDCASLKNLPEQIVYSQFFVPRLKRHEIHRAILEPAKLSGNKISNRLIERLINDLSDGQDQLPILQHALNRIWRMAHLDGDEEMDLLHYAKCGGLPSEKLDADSKKRFDDWLKQQPSYKNEILKNSSLGNVLNSHARDLYFQTPEYYRTKIKANDSDENIHALLRTIFLFLTKINDNRAVRNRATVKEIESSLKEKISAEKIHALTGLFRDTENTLLLPFFNRTSGETTLHLHDTLDITHESLIRNWKELLEWTTQESENMNVLEDFRKQVNFWIESRKDGKYLLAEGPLNYFEHWLRSFNPNTFSIVKYDIRPVELNTKINEAENFLRSGNDFINESKNAIRKRKRLLITALTCLIVLLSAFTVWAMMERNKALHQTEIADLKTQEAQRSKESALQQREIAENAKEQAVQNESLAVSSQKEAQVAQKAAELAEQQALENLQSAKKNAELARSEAERATNALNESEKSKKEALREKLNAEIQEKKAMELSYLATAQNLAIKSSFRSDNPELQSLMALQAFKFNSENKGEIQDPVIYDALSTASKNFLKEETILLTETEQRNISFYPETQQLITFGRNGVLYKFNLAKGTQNISRKVQLFEENETILSDPKNKRFLSANPSGKLSRWNLTENDPPKITASVQLGNGQLRTITFAGDENPGIITGGKDSLITFLDLPTLKVKNQLKADFAIKSICYDNENKTGYVLSDGGKLMKVNAAFTEITKLPFNDQIKSPVSSFQINQKKSQAIIGFADGKMSIYELKDLNRSQAEPLYTFTEFSARIEIIELNLTKTKMAVSGADNSIKIFDLDKPNVKPLRISGQKTKARALSFTPEDDLWIGSADRTVRLAETSNVQLAEKLCASLKRNLTQLEWQELISQELPYQKTCTQEK